MLPLSAGGASARRRLGLRLLGPILSLAVLAGATTAVARTVPSDRARASGSTPAVVVVTPQILTPMQGRRDEFVAGALPAPSDPYGTASTYGTPYADRIVLHGWAADPSSTAPVRVDVAIDGVVRGGGPTGAGGLYDLVVPAPAGAATACTIARNTGPGIDVELGCRDLRPPPLTGGYGWMGTEPRGHPLRFDPCSTVTIAYNAAGGPWWGRTELDAAVEEIRGATGLDLRVVTTSEPAALGRPLVDLGRYGASWAPILVGYSSPDVISALAGGVAGLGGPSTAWGPDGRVSVTGIVILDGPQTAGLTSGWGTGPTLAKLMAHELGHLLGLAHVSDTAQLMNPTIPSRGGGYGPGDRSGLAHLGAGQSCRRVPPLPVTAEVGAAATGPIAIAPDGQPVMTDHLAVG